MKKTTNIHKNKYRVSVQSGCSAKMPRFLSHKKQSNTIAVGQGSLCKKRGSSSLSLKKESEIGVSVFDPVKNTKNKNTGLLCKNVMPVFFTKQKTTNEKTMATLGKAKRKQGQPVNLNLLEQKSIFAKHLLGKCEAKSVPVLKKESALFQRKSVHNQFLQFLKSSSHFGRKSRHLDFAFPWHASMCNKFSGVRNKVPHISAQQTLQSLVEAFYCIALVLRKGGKVLVANKNSEFSPLFYPHSGVNVFSLEKTKEFEKKEDIVKNKGVESHPFFFDQKKTNKSPLFKNSLHSVYSTHLQSKYEDSANERNERKVKCAPAMAPLKWVGGCLTNWKEISKSVATLLYFSKRFGRFIKQNNIHFPRFKKMKNSFQGFINIEREQLLLKEKPQLLFLFNTDESQQILHEAIALQIPVVALTDSSTDLSQITYPIPINSDSTHLVYWCLSQLMQITERQDGLLE